MTNHDAQLPKFSVGQYTTRPLSFAEDVAAYTESGVVAGIGIDAGLKPWNADDVRVFAASGLQATFCFPATPSILPVKDLPGSTDPHQRIDAVCAGLEALSAFRPLAGICITGPIGDYSTLRAKDYVTAGLRQIAQTAASLGMRMAIEPMHSSIAGSWSFLTSIADTVALLDTVNEPNLGFMLDVWHLWDSPDLLGEIAQHGDRIVGVQVNDRRHPTRGWCDRVLPGDGVADLSGIMRALRAADYAGWYELEIFSDDGTFGTDYPDSLWKADPVSLIRHGHQKFIDLWSAAE